MAITLSPVLVGAQTATRHKAETVRVYNRSRIQESDLRTLQLVGETPTAAGFSVETENVKNYDEIQVHKNVPASIHSCHTAKIGRYLVEGHVPVAVIERLMRERPKGVTGIGVAGMPAGSPGMESSTPFADDLARRPRQ